VAHVSGCAHAHTVLSPYSLRTWTCDYRPTRHFISIDRCTSSVMSSSCVCEWSDLSEESSNSCSWSSSSIAHWTLAIMPSSILDTSIGESSQGSCSEATDWTPSPIKTMTLTSTPLQKKVTPTSPRIQTLKCTERSPNSQFVSQKWELFNVMTINGCQESCTTAVHDLTEHDILLAHSSFVSKSCSQQRHWIYDYFSTHCPNTEDNAKSPSGMKFFLCGKAVCQPLWLAALGVSTSRFTN